MKAPSPETLARALHASGPPYQQLAVDVLRCSGYTDKAAKRALAGWEAASSSLQGNGTPL